MEDLNKPRKSFATVALRDGTALVAGGSNADDVPFSSTWVFDPSTREWRTGGLLGEARAAPLMTALADGRALILGGSGCRRCRAVDIGDLRSGHVDLDTGRITPARGPGSGRRRSCRRRRPGPGLRRYRQRAVRTAYVFDPARGDWRRVDWAPNPYGYALVPTTGGALVIGGTDGGELEVGTEAPSTGSTGSTRRPGGGRRRRPCRRHGSDRWPRHSPMGGAGRRRCLTQRRHQWRAAEHRDLRPRSRSVDTGRRSPRAATDRAWWSSCRTAASWCSVGTPRSITPRSMARSRSRSAPNR